MGASNFELVFISSTWDCTTFHNFLPMFKKKIQKLAGLWLAGEVVNHVGIYGSKAAEGLSAFQRRSCSVLWHSEFHGNLEILSWNIIEKSLKFFEACLWEPCQGLIKWKTFMHKFLKVFRWVHGVCGNNLKSIILKHITMNSSLSIPLWHMTQNFVTVMAKL